MNVEIKAPYGKGRAAFVKKMPKCYIPQVTVQMMNAEIAKTHFICFTPSGCSLFTVLYDPILAQRLCEFIVHVTKAVQSQSWKQENGSLKIDGHTFALSRLIRERVDAVCKATLLEDAFPSFIDVLFSE